MKLSDINEKLINRYNNSSDYRRFIQAVFKIFLNMHRKTGAVTNCLKEFDANYMNDLENCNSIQPEKCLKYYYIISKIYANNSWYNFCCHTISKCYYNILCSYCENTRNSCFSKYLKNCKNCTTCKQCEYCTNCTRTTNSTYCNDCNFCNGCNHCKHCVSCNNSENCVNCNNCDNCKYCSYCNTKDMNCQCVNYYRIIHNHCNNCTGCINCSCCYDCNHCVNCIDCEQCDDLYNKSKCIMYSNDILHDHIAVVKDGYSSYFNCITGTNIHHE